MLKNTMRCSIFTFVLFVFLTTCLAQASQAGLIWNAQKVDWYVTKHESHKSQRQHCIINWVYDERYKLALQKTSVGLDNSNVYFSLDVGGVGGVMAIGPGEVYDVDMIVNDTSYPITGEAINNTTLIVSLPRNIIGLDDLLYMQHLKIYVQEGEYNFPLANAYENVTVFKECDENATQPLRPVENYIVEQEPTSQNSNMIRDKAQELIIDAQPLAVGDNENTGQDNLPELEKTSIELAKPLPPSETPPPPSADLMPSSKQSDRMLNDARYSKGVSGGEEVYNAQRRDASVTNNLMRKLILLEKEKEELRMKLLNVKEDRVISEIIACKPEAPISGETNPNKKVLAKFEETIENLRVENEILKSSLSSGNKDEEQIATLNEEISSLKNQVEALKDRNSDMNNSLADYQKRIEMFSDTLNDGIETSTPSIENFDSENNTVDASEENAAENILGTQ